MNNQERHSLATAIATAILTVNHHENDRIRIYDGGLPDCFSRIMDKNVLIATIEETLANIKER